LIVDTAIETLAVTPAAALGEIAAAAGVSRSTLHRHFADRADLVAAIDEECRRRFDVATHRAEPTDGTGLDALTRLCLEYFELGPVLGLVFADNAIIDPDEWPDDGEAGMIMVIRRGQRDGTVDPQLPCEWLIITFWVLLFGAWQAAQHGETQRRDVPGLLTRTLVGAFGNRT
jgi:AcrR family transcriptional regulator